MEEKIVSKFSEQYNFALLFAGAVWSILLLPQKNFLLYSQLVV